MDGDLSMVDLAAPSSLAVVMLPFWIESPYSTAAINVVFLETTTTEDRFLLKIRYRNG